VAWTSASNVLCVRLDTLGDVLMTGPAMRALKWSGAHPRITLLTSPAGAAVAAFMPEIDEVLVYGAPWMKATPAGQPAAVDRAMIDTLRARRFDAAAIFTVYSQSPLPAALLCHLSDIAMRLAHCRENAYQLLTDPVPEREPHELVRHEVRRQLDLVAAVGAAVCDERLALDVPEGRRERARACLSAVGIDAAEPWAVVHPGATAASRRYPPSLWAEACRRLVAEHGWQLALTGTGGERSVVEEVRAAAGVPLASLAGRLDLGELAGVLEAAPVLLAGNTGPVHVAAAVGTPVVDVYALTNPQHTPWGVRNRVFSHDVPCRWCYKSVCPEGHHRCLVEIDPREVAEAAVALVAAGPPRLAQNGRGGSAGGPA
jgi:lipopolysaccharide heptosyltransferase II